MCVFIYVILRFYVYMCVCTCVCVCVYMCVHVLMCSTCRYSDLCEHMCIMM